MTNAGYDIQSFNEKQSIIIDRFIEVKSYQGKIPYFFWSRNEFLVAEREQNEYWLYLVNRNEMNKKGYTPIMIQNPHTNILINEEWNKQIEKYKIEYRAEL